MRSTVCAKEEFSVATCGRCQDSLAMALPLQDGKTEGVGLQPSLAHTAEGSAPGLAVSTQAGMIGSAECVYLK